MTDIDVVIVREGKHLKGYLLGFVLGPVGKGILEKAFVNSVKAIEAASNDFYAAKQKEYRKSGNYLTRSLVELTKVGQDTSISRVNERLEAFPTWVAASIEQRHSVLIALAQEIWRVITIAV